MIFGDNNRGKTYLSYAVYGLYNYVRNRQLIALDDSEIMEQLPEISKEYSQTIKRNVFNISDSILDTAALVIEPRNSSAGIETPFAITSERTGIALFYKDLDINRNQIIDSMLKNPPTDADAIRNLLFLTSRYALPIKDNIDIIRDYGEIRKRESFLYADNPAYKTFLEKWNQFIGGDYADNGGSTVFLTRNTEIPLHITSSAVKSLFLLDIYIKHCAQPHDVLFIDEPELNLNPKNQIALARLLLEIANFGVKLVITTHSDYIIREMNIVMAEKSKSTALLPDLELDTIHAYHISDAGVIEELPKDEDGCVSEPLLDRVIADQSERFENAAFGDDDA
jgi:hypothetical protein